MKLRITLEGKLAERAGRGYADISVEKDSQPAASVLRLAIRELFGSNLQGEEADFAQLVLSVNGTPAIGAEPVGPRDVLCLAYLGEIHGGQQAADGGMTPNLYKVTHAPLSVERTAALVADPNHGAALTFIGTTREYTNGQRTVLLEYEAYVPMAIASLEQIGLDIAQRWGGAKCAITHRLGVVPVGAISVVIAVSAPHRESCYEASRYAIERLKQTVPIWKKEVWADGSEWKGSQLGPWKPHEPL